MLATIYLRVLTVIAIFVTIIFLVSPLKDVLWPYVVALIVAYLLNPLCNRFSNIGISKHIVSLVLVLIITLFVFLVISAIVPLFIKQYPALVENAGNGIALLQAKLKSLSLDFNLDKYVDDFLKDLNPQTFKEISGGLVSVLRKIGNFGNNVAFFALIPIMLYYLLATWNDFEKSLSMLVPMRLKKKATDLSKTVDNSVRLYLKGQVIVMVTLGIYYIVCFSIIGLDSAILLGTLIGIIVFVPYLGALIGFVLTSLLTLVQFGDFSYLFIIGGMFALGQTAESLFLTPKIIGQKIGLHPVWIMFALTAGGNFFGIIGVVIAMPIASAIISVIKFLVNEYKNSEYYNTR